MVWQRVRIPVPNDLSPDERLRAGLAMVETMVENAKRGIGIRKAGDRVRPKQFAPYTKEYAKRKGTSRTNVNLTLSGDMLEALDVLSHKKGSVLIGFENGSEENDKAEGNITGSYGKPSPNPRKARNFLGLTRSEIAAIVRTNRANESGE